MMPSEHRSLQDKLAVFIAEGFGIGRLPFAPGTFGTALGFAWIFLLLLPQSVPIYIAGIIVGFFAAVWLGARAEKILQQEDPGSIVIDEITALPLAFLPAVVLTGAAQPLPPFAYFSGKSLLLPILAFILFRIFDIFKPFGIARIQSLPHGWGLVLDDFLAAIPSAILLVLYIKIAG
jgi:phosphatidylglycerophosphatase A